MIHLNCFRRSGGSYLICGSLQLVLIKYFGKGTIKEKLHHMCFHKALKYQNVSLRHDDVELHSFKPFCVSPLKISIDHYIS